MALTLEDGKDVTKAVPMNRMRATMCAFLLVLASFVNHVVPARADMSVPTGLSFYQYDAEATPILADDPASAKPMAIGGLAEGGDSFTLQVGLNPWTGPVDIYFGVQILTLGSEIYLFLEDGSLKALSQVGLLPWKVGIMANVSETLLGGSISASALPPGDYRLFLGVTTDGFMNAMYLWQADFQVARRPAPPDSFDITIQVAPSTLNIQSLGQVVTVHTDIAYNRVAGGTVTVNGVEISWWKADNQGNFVAKFEMSEVKALADSGRLVVPGENVLTLTGSTTDGAEFTGTQTIMVINVEPAGSGGP